MVEQLWSLRNLHGRGMPCTHVVMPPCTGAASCKLFRAHTAHLDLNEVPQVVIRPVHLGMPPHQPDVQVRIRQQPAGRLRTAVGGN